MRDIQAEQRANVEATLVNWAQSAMDVPLENAMKTQPWGPFSHLTSPTKKQDDFYKIMKMYEGVDRMIAHPECKS